MEAPTGPASPTDDLQPAKSRPGSLREAFEALSLSAQFRVAAVVAVTATLLIVQVVGALWDTVAAGSQAVGQARAKTAAMAARLEAAGGGALDVLDGYPQFLVASFRLESGEVLQQYVRADAPTQPGSVAAAALARSTAPTGIVYWLSSHLALTPIYVVHTVDLSPGLSGTVSIVVDHHWIWGHAWHRMQQTPVALLLGCLIALLAARVLQRLVAEPLAQLVRSTRVPGAPEPAETRRPPRRANELTELAGNFEAAAGRLVEYERAMSTLRHASAQQIVERTRELEQRLRKAEALTRSKDDFLANMSHEIRTPMNGVLGMAELLAGTELDKRQRRFVDSMRAAAETMMQIINDILDDSKIEAGKMDVVREPFDVRELAETAGQLYAGRAESKKLEMICRIEPTVPSVLVGDALRLRQVLGNLLSNAVKYTERGEIEIRVGLDDQRDGQCRLHFSVRDTGPGIPAADQSGVFEAFTQLDNGTRLGGTGLGLSIATRLVKLMGGERIDLRSEVGRGSTFSFVLPLAVAQAAPVPNRSSDEFSGLRVLVVDDNPTSHLLLEEMLANWSAEVTVLNRGRSVGDKMHDVATRGRPFDVVLLDHSLPDATTEQLLRTIRLDPAIAGTYVVLMSALDFSAAYEGSRAIAPDMCIAKPVRAQLLHNALQASRQPRAATTAPPVADRPERRATSERGTVPALGLDVLVVDDNVINREVAVAMLEELRCRVDVAEDGRVAVDKSRQRRYDAILMDCQMPELDGYGATEAIRGDEQQRGHAPTTIVALTANVMNRDRDRCLAAGMNAFLAKPFKAAQLLELLQPIAEARGTFVAVPSVLDVLQEDAAEQSPPAAVTPASNDEPAPAPGPDAARAADAIAVDAEPVDDPLFTNTMVNALFETPASAAPSPTLRLPVLDLEQVEAIRGLGKPLVFERLCEMLFATSKEAFARLDAALASNDLAEIAAAAHAFKSPVSNLGGRRLADLLERCESAARDQGDLTAVRRAATGLKAHYAALVAALGAEIRRGAGPVAGTG